MQIGLIVAYYQELFLVIENQGALLELRDYVMRSHEDEA